jgi:hypothetical protein
MKKALTFRVSAARDFAGNSGMKNWQKGKAPLENAYLTPWSARGLWGAL